MTEPKPAEEEISPVPDYVAFSLFVCCLVILGNHFATNRNVGLVMDGGMIATCFYLGFKGFRYGIIKELLTAVRFAISLGGAYGGKGALGEALGLPGILGSIIGFYLLFLLLFMLSGFAVKSFQKNTPPSFAGRFLGLGLGIGEGVAIFSILAFGLTFFPSQVKLEDAVTGSIGTQISDAIMGPLLTHAEGSPMVVLKLAQEAKRGIDPQKIDREALVAQFQTLSANPKIRSVTDDPEIAQLAKDRNFPVLLKHPKVVGLMSDPELMKLGQNLDWSAIASAVRQGIKPPNP